MKRLTAFVLTGALALSMSVPAALNMTPAKTVKAAGKTYTVRANKAPKSVKKSKAYSSRTKHWLTIQYYLKKLQKKGGTLKIKKGTYKIPNTLYIPSNTTIIFESGAKMVKTMKAGKGMKPAVNMFVLLKYNNRNKKGVAKKYNSVKNVKIIGKGSAYIDLKNIQGAHGISAAHNKNVSVTGMTFKNMNGGHGIEVNGVQKCTITNCSFINSKYPAKKNYNKEAINVDSDDPKTGGFTLKWGKKDKTTNNGLTITKCKFVKQNRAIGTHQYSATSKNICYHKNITISNNTFSGMRESAIYVKAWKNTKIYNNSFSNVGFGALSPTSKTLRHCIEGGGIDGGMRIYNNTFNKIKKTPIYFVGQKNNGGASGYRQANNTITADDLNSMKLNNGSSLGKDGDSKYNSYQAIFFSKARPSSYKGIRFLNNLDRAGAIGTIGAGKN